MDTILLFMLPAGLWAQDAGVAATTAAPDATAGALGELATGLNTVWMLLAAMLVFFMQPGFALGRSRVHPYQEHGQRADEKSGRLHVRLHPVLVHRLRADVRHRRFCGRPPFFQLGGDGQNHRQRIAHRRLPDFPDCILRHGGHHRVRSHGGTY